MDLQIIQKAQQGDMAAFEQIYKECAGFVFNVSYRITNHYDDAQEVTQEVFVTVYKKLPDFREQAALKTWLYRIAVNTAINYIKKESGYRRKADRYKADQQTQHKPSNIEKDISAMDQQARVQVLLEPLPEPQRQCMILKHLQGLQCQEIADILQENVNTVKTRLKRARETLVNMSKKGNNHEL